MAEEWVKQPTTNYKLRWESSSKRQVMIRKSSLSSVCLSSKDFSLQTSAYCPTVESGKITNSTFFFQLSSQLGHGKVMSFWPNDWRAWFNWMTKQKSLMSRLTFPRFYLFPFFPRPTEVNGRPTNFDFFTCSGFWVFLLILNIKMLTTDLGWSVPFNFTIKCDNETKSLVRPPFFSGLDAARKYQYSQV